MIGSGLSVDFEIDKPLLVRWVTVTNNMNPGIGSDSPTTT